MTVTDREAADERRGKNPSPAESWSRALTLTAPITANPGRLFASVIDECADRTPEAPALLSDCESLTYAALAERSNQYARWALEHGIAKGDVICLLMPNRPEYMAVWLGITRIGGIVGLLNTTLTSASLAHCINVAAPKHVIAAAELMEPLSGALPRLERAPVIWVHGAECGGFRRIDPEVEGYRCIALSDEERPAITIDDCALYIYTSGTTGLPKAANVSHARLMQWTHWFAGMMDVRNSDRMYNTLPMYHSAGGVLATGAVLVGGGSVVIRDCFSVREFWNDVIRWDCSLFQYIGELCRYLLHAEPNSRECEHGIRMCCGNGLSSDVWNAFKNRFRIPRILEFYAATEGNVSLFNVEEKPGAVGRVPLFIAHRSLPTLVKVDVDAVHPVRKGDGFCVRCESNEIGEALGRITEDRSNVGSRFDGYTNKEASAEKILRDVFTRGDAWFRTGDLMRRDESGYFYFVDRIGDTFRWKGENISTLEVSKTICSFPGVREAVVYGVAIPGADGKAGMATLVATRELDLAAFRRYLIDCLPPSARPLMVRVRTEIDVTSTFKYAKDDLVRQGYDPFTTPEPIYFNDPVQQAFVQLDREVYERLLSGGVRL
jgi:fatty-acyl-CoA synthase